MQIKVLPRFFLHLLLASAIISIHIGTPQADGPLAIVLAAGDIGVCGSAGPAVTAKLLDQLEGTILALGDLAYKSGSPAQFLNCYDPTWGRHKQRTRPVPGNHDYWTEKAAGYFEYWGARAGPPELGYYSFDLGDWHLIAINSILSGDAYFEQNRWLTEDLRRTRKRCILAYWHHPVFSSGKHGDDPHMLPVFEVLHDAGASIVLSGHDHIYERFSPQTPEGEVDERRGIRAFVAGTGGANLYDFDNPNPNSQFRYNSDWGLLRLHLEPGSYSWEFVIAGGQVIDSGRSSCALRPAS